MAGIPIESLNLSVRATNVLHRMNIHEVEQLLNIPIEYIAEQRNMGVKTIAEIKGAIRQINIGDVSIEDLENLTPADSVNFSKRNFSEEQIEELSYHPITELNLSNRAMNALLKVGCETMAILAEMTLTDIRNMKALGAKTCDEIWDELNQWIEANMLISEENKDSIISEKEQLFYQWLAGKIKPISPIYWKRLRNIVLNSGYIEMVDWDIEGIDDKFIRKVLALSDFRVSIKNFFLKYAPDGIIEKDAFEKQLALVGLEFDSSILIEIILDDAICIIEHGYYILNRPHAMRYLQEKYLDSSDRNGEIILKRLSGDNLQMIGDMYGLTRERVRQILVQTAKKMPLMYEDYFSEPYKYFKLSKEEFCNVFPSCGETGYEYLFIKYKKGDMSITPKTVQNYMGRFSERVSAFWSEESIRRDKQTVSKTEMVYRVLLSNGNGSMSMEEFEKEYYNYIERRNYPRERLTINQRTVVNHLRNAKHIVFDRKNYVRYCEANPKVIWEKIDFTQYRNLVISTELIYRDYAELMEELDIRDGYELFYVIKSSIENWNTSLFEINCRRVPVIVMGDGSEEHQAIQLLKELSPIDFQSYYEAYEERFGVRKESAQGNPTISGILANYYTEGIYAIDVPSIDERDVAAFKEVLEIKNFWFTDELEREFEKVCIHSSDDAFNSAAFKRLGYTLNMGYAYNDIYSSVVNYFDAELFSSDIVDLNELDRRLVNLSIFNSALYKKKMDLEYIEVAPKILMSISQVEYVYGITISDVKKLQEWVLKCEDKYFNAHSLWNRLSESGFSEKLQNNEWMCTCIFRQQEALASLQVAGGIILCREYSELNFGLICKWLVEKNGRMTIQNLTLLFNDTFSTRVLVSKIAEKMKAYGLWETFVTDSFEEYIDNLVVNTDLELDDNDLFQEEFF
ncbi:DNA-directed RNA polymerase subunit alpha C-terminal domain-containing protein [Bacteroides acidifaciens]|uniref:DNA-directed RNA polymerase subunit alpha C-terminal domain-containing protein n=2 Tax=Bacteria TaxID=2 RepID=UPI002431CFE1|nr:DNA-directed RNA polymerase subunit alpha C-terminal domain-containing protein [Bacteroides acidifaciens]